MLKRILSLSLCAMLVVCLASYAFAEVKFGGDIRVRGIMKKDWDFNADTDTAAKDTRYWDQRLRLTASAPVAENVTVNGRMTVSEGVWGHTDAASKTYQNVQVHDDDYANVVVKVGPGSFTAGRQLASWGNKLIVWNAGTDRLKYVAGLDFGTVGVFLDKKTEKDDGKNSNDYDDYGLLFVKKMDTMEFGVIGVSYSDKTAAKDVTGTWFDAYFNGTFAPVTVLAEVSMKSGDLFKDTKDKNATTGFVAGVMNFDPVTAMAAIAFASGGKSGASKYFTPTLFFGTSQASACVDFGAVDGESATAIVLGASMKATDALTVGATLATGSGITNKDGKVTELDLTGKYNLAKGADYFVEFGYLTVKDIGNDDPAMVLLHRVEVSF